MQILGKQGVKPEDNLLKVLDKNLLKAFVPLNMLSEGALRQLLDLQHVRSYQAGETVFTMGNNNVYVAYLLSGEVESQGEQGELESITAEGARGWHPLSSGPYHKRTIVAKNDVVLVLFDREKFDEQLALEQALGDVLEQLRGNSAYAEDLPWIERFLQLSLFKQLPSANILAVLERLVPERCRAGEVIVKQGEAGESCYIVKSGVCEVSVILGDQETPLVVATLEAGQWFGEEALLVQGPRNATVTAASDSVLMRLSVEDFDELLKKPLVDKLSFTMAEDDVRNGARWVDVRTAGEFHQWHLPNAIHLPLQHVRTKYSILNRKLRHVVYCDTGRRSAAAAFLLQELGIDALWLSEPVTVPFES